MFLADEKRYEKMVYPVTDSRSDADLGSPRSLQYHWGFGRILALGAILQTSSR